MSLVGMPAGDVSLEAELVVAPGATGLVIFAHGSGSGRHSPRNRFVAGQLQRRGLATLLVDLLTTQEDQDRQTRFDIRLLFRRLTAVTDWAAQNKSTSGLAIGYFGASTGAAAAMFATQGNAKIKALVSRGGRVDLASEAAGSITAPTLLIVGQQDEDVLQMNQTVYSELTCEKSIRTIPGATHLFEEPGALEQVADLATDWFVKYL